MQDNPARGNTDEGRSKMTTQQLNRSDLESSSEGKRGDGDDGAEQKKRVHTACINCRKRKVRCSGEQSGCVNCNSAAIECFYEPYRRDKLRLANQRTEALAALLADLRLRVNYADRQVIDNTLRHVRADLVKRRKQSTSSSHGSDSPSGEARSPASEGSNEDLDLLDEDLLRSKEARAMGYVGKNSTVAWLKSLTREVKEDHDGKPHGSAKAADVSTFKTSQVQRGKRTSYNDAKTSLYLDTDSLEPNVAVDSYKLPSPEVGKKLLDVFMRTVYTSLPITPINFTTEFQKVYEAIRSGHPYHVDDAWLALLNLCFAVGSHYLTISNQDWWATGQKDHLIYMARAVRLLDHDHGLLVTAPDLTTIQAIGLLSFFYMSIGHASRSWAMIGRALRFALALGLHLRNEDPGILPSRKEMLIRTWWSLHYIESLASSMTGRPCMLSPEDCTVALPQPSSEGYSDSAARSASDRYNQAFSSGKRLNPMFGTSNSSQESVQKSDSHSTYLPAHVGISRITQNTLLNLYSPRVGSKSWTYIQNEITKLLKELEEWRNHALASEHEELAGPLLLPDRNRELTLLKFAYFSNIILITRPCLCRTERRNKDQSNASVNFNENTARRCVRAAQEMIDLLPENLNLRHLFETGPWWTLVHYIMQSVAVLLLELSYQSQHIMEDSTTIIPRVKKAICWLHVMSETYPPSKRAYNVVKNILRHSRRQFQAKVEHLLSGDEDEDEEDQRNSGKQSFTSSSSTTEAANKAPAAHPSLTDHSKDAGVMGCMSSVGSKGLLDGTDTGETTANVLPFDTNSATFDHQTLYSMPQFQTSQPTAFQNNQYSNNNSSNNNSNNNYNNNNPFSFPYHFVTSFDQVSFRNFVGADSMAADEYSGSGYMGAQSTEGNLMGGDKTMTGEFLPVYTRDWSMHGWP